jgi:hypothetical protein
MVSSMRRITVPKGLWVLAGLLGGCATARSAAPPSAGRVAAAEATVSGARSSGADADPQAGRYLRYAEAELGQAKDRLGQGDNLGAELLLARAEADADVSQLLARQAKATTEATTAEARLRGARTAPAAPGEEVQQ